MSPGRSRSQSASSPNHSLSTPNSPLLTRGFASLRRSHRHTASAAEQRQAISAMAHPPTTSASTPRQQTRTELSLDTGVSVIPSSNTGDEDLPVHEPRIRLVPNVNMSSRCFVFDVIERTLQAGVILKLGRYSDRNVCSDRLSFKSKVVSRSHAELWQENGKIFIKDTGSSSGTFVNRARLSPANITSRPHTIQDGDLIQMGVDYKGGGQAMYRAVKMRFEVDRSSLQQTTFSRVAFRQLKHCLRTSLASAANTNDTIRPSTTTAASPLASVSTPNSTQIRASALSASHEQLHVPLSCSSSMESISSMEVQECCICLYSIGPSQALFIAPCSHIYHYRCLRPILAQNYPGFSCPLCRTYSDLDATANIEKEQMERILQPKRTQRHGKKNNSATAHPIDNSNGRCNDVDQSELTTNTGLVAPPTSSELSPHHTSMEHAISIPAPEIHTCPQNFDNETLMAIYTTTSVAPGAITNTATASLPISSPSSSSEDDDHHQDYRHHTPEASSTTYPATTTTPVRHSPLLSHQKSIGSEGFLATTLIGSPSPFDLMLHQHVVPPPTFTVDSPTTNMNATTSATIPNPTQSSATVSSLSSRHHQQT